MHYSNFDNTDDYDINLNVPHSYIIKNDVNKEYKKLTKIYEKLKNNTSDDYDGCDCKSIDCIECLYNKVSNLRICDKLSEINAHYENVENLNIDIKELQEKKKEYCSMVMNIFHIVDPEHIEKFDNNNIIKKIDASIENIQECIETKKHENSEVIKFVEKCKFMRNSINIVSKFRCCICEVKNIYPVIYECGHYSCEECYDKLTVKKCSICRKDIVIFKVYN